MSANDAPVFFRLTQDHVRLSRLSTAQCWVLAVLTLLGAAIRIAYQAGRSFEGDEIGTLIYMRESTRFILSHYDTWLTMQPFIALEKWIALLFGNQPWVLTALPLTASIAIIPLTAFFALYLSQPRVALMAATLVSVNPALISYSPVIRAYSLMGALALVSLILFYRWLNFRSWSRAWACSVAVTLLCLAHLIGVYVPLFMVLVLLVGELNCLRVGELKMWLQRNRSLLVALGIGLMITGAYVALFYLQLKERNARWTWHAPTSAGYLPEVFRRYFGEGIAVILPLICLAAGTWWAGAARRIVLVCWMPFLVAVVAMSFQGVSHYSWAYSRFLLYNLPLLICVMAEGIETISGRWKHSGSLAVCLVLIISIGWLPAISHLFDANAAEPWCRVGPELNRRKESPLVVATGHGELHLRPFFFDAPQRLIQPDGIAKLDLTARSALCLVSRDAELDLDAIKSCYGDIQVFLYPSRTLEQNLRQLCIDLNRALRFRADAGLEGYYQVLAYAYQALGEQEKSRHSMRMSQACLQYSPRARYRLPQHMSEAQRRYIVR